jgi:hypothetical protein
MLYLMLAVLSATIPFDGGSDPWIWSEQVRLIANDPSAGQSFGVHVSAHGEDVLVGASNDPHAGFASGAAYVFTRTGAAWAQSVKLTASDAKPNEYFGHSVALSGGTAAIGAPHNGNQSQAPGAAYVFERDGAVWKETARLEGRVPSVMNHHDSFGMDVAVSGDTVLVGAHDEDGVLPGSGAAYVFVRAGTTWREQARLVPSSPSGYFFGVSVALSGDRALVGSAGSLLRTAHVFERVGTVWSETATIVDPSTVVPTTFFGRHVSLSGDVALIGSHFLSNQSGAAYVFELQGSTWTERAKLISSDIQTADYFGSAVSIVGDKALVGAYRVGPYDNGAAYIFSRNGGAWDQETKLLPATNAARYGWSVALSGADAVVGALSTSHSGVQLAGAVHINQATPAAPQTYCTAGTSAAGCRAQIAGTGTASASAFSGFTLDATGVEGGRAGLFFYGPGGRTANAWGTGTSLQCVAPPFRRASFLAGTGTPGACDGVLSQDLNALWCSVCPSPAANPGAGTLLQAQLWYRDPANTGSKTSSLSDSIEFGVGL